MQRRYSTPFITVDQHPRLMLTELVEEGHVLSPNTTINPWRQLKQYTVRACARARNRKIRKRKSQTSTLHPSGVWFGSNTTINPWGRGDINNLLTRLGKDEDEDEKEKISVSSSSFDTSTPQQKQGGDDGCQGGGADVPQIRHRNRRHRHGGGFPQPTCTPAWSRWQRSGP